MSLNLFALFVQRQKKEVSPRGAGGSFINSLVAMQRRTNEGAPRIMVRAGLQDTLRMSACKELQNEKPKHSGSKHMVCMVAS